MIVLVHSMFICLEATEVWVIPSDGSNCEGMMFGFPGKAGLLDPSFEFT